LRLKPSFRWSIYAAFAVLFLTGAGWLVANSQKEFSTGEAWQQTAVYLLMVHGGAAMATLLLLGALIPLHALRAWRAAQNRALLPRIGNAAALDELDPHRRRMFAGAVVSGSYCFGATEIEVTRQADRGRRSGGRA